MYDWGCGLFQNHIRWGLTFFRLKPMKTYTHRIIDRICGDCEDPFMGTSRAVYCPKCSSRRSYERTMQKRKNLLSNGLCHICASVPPATGLKMCSACLERRRIETAALRSLRVSQGLCTHCGKPHLASGKNKAQQCEVCLLKKIARGIGDVSRWKELKALYIGQRGLCPYIGKPIYLGYDANLDHIIPRARGGSNDTDNLEWVHKRINMMKGDSTKDEFREWLKANPINVQAL